MNLIRTILVWIGDDMRVKLYEFCTVFVPVGVGMGIVLVGSGWIRI